MDVFGMPMVNFIVDVVWIQLAWVTVNWWTKVNMVEFPDHLSFLRNAFSVVVTG
jgi:hypothetical protein